MKKVIVFLAVIVALCQARKPVPSYIKTCNRNDPSFEDCFAKNANLAMSYIAKGDKNYNINPLLPLNFRELLIVDIPPLKLMLLDILVYGAENMTISDPGVDFESRKIQFIFNNPEIIWKSKYVMVVEENGMNIETEGNAEITFRNGKYAMLFGYNLQKLKGHEYANITKYNSNFLKVDMEYKLDNLDTNPIIKREWEKVNKNFVNHQVEVSCAEIVSSYINKILTVVPFNEVFPDN